MNKQVIALLVVMTIFLGCDKPKTERDLWRENAKYKYIVKVYDDAGWSWHTLYCDNITSKNIKEAEIVVGGDTLSIFAEERIQITLNEFYTE